MAPPRELPPRVRAMLDDERAPTALLEEFRAAYDADDNLWWRVGCGHHQNLFDAACETLDAHDAAKPVPEQVLATNARVIRERNELRELVDQLWGELPVDVVLHLAEQSPELVEACRANHELVAHGAVPADG